MYLLHNTPSRRLLLILMHVINIFRASNKPNARNSQFSGLQRIFAAVNMKRWHVSYRHKNMGHVTALLKKMIDHRLSTFRLCMHEPCLHLDIAENTPARSMADQANFALEVDLDDIGLDPSHNISLGDRLDLGLDENHTQQAVHASQSTNAILDLDESMGFRTNEM